MAPIRMRPEFDRKSAALDARSIQILDAVAQLLVEHSEIACVRLQGYRDSDEPVVLADARARAVATWLIAHGIASQRLRIATGGETASAERKVEIAQDERCASWRPVVCPMDDIRAAGPAERTIRVIVRYDQEACIVGDARHVTVLLDERPVRSVSLPCFHPPHGPSEIRAPAAAFDGGAHTVDLGMHTITVRDEDTRADDQESFSVPHVVLDRDGFSTGTRIDAFVGRTGVHVRGPSLGLDHEL